ncbi:mucin-2-like [Paramacrobiotus metropolitanus]|uniref:mucin-2-like n=1 Tax=Paramacrobiotus metropolitanus TaxID=2943436 RepID=UPI002445A7E9|nr:mucin-2-like [Paramacrobiotus metropolitanus]
MMKMLVPVILLVFLIAQSSLARPSPRKAEHEDSRPSQCNHPDTAFAEYNSHRCRFFRCDGGQQVHLHCHHVQPTELRSALDSYYLTGSKVPLSLEVSSEKPLPDLLISEQSLGNSASLIHKLVINTLSLFEIDKNIWRFMPNLKILNLTAAHDGSHLTSDFFNGATALESLSLDIGGRVNLSRSVVTLRALQCFNLRGKAFVCDCAMLDIMRRAPIWRQNGAYENPLVEGDTWECGTHHGATCGDFPQKGVSLSKFTLPDCPMVPFAPVGAGVAPLSGSQISCDYKNLKVRLRNVGVTTNLAFRLNGSLEERCEGRLHAGTVHFDVPLNQCGTTINHPRGTKLMVIQNKIVVTKKEADNRKAAGRSVKVAGGKEIPVECRLNQLGDLSQQFQTPAPAYPIQQGDGQVRVKMDVQPTTSLGGGYAFDITLDTTADGQWPLSVEKCWATPTNNASDDNQHVIISNGCYVDPSVEMTLETSERYIRQSFTMDEFQFPHAGNAQVYIHCEVEPCGYENGYCKWSQEQRCEQIGITTERPPSETTLHAILKQSTEKPTEQPVTDDITTEVTTEITTSEDATSEPSTAESGDVTTEVATTPESEPTTMEADVATVNVEDTTVATDIPTDDTDVTTTTEDIVQTTQTADVTDETTDSTDDTLGETVTDTPADTEDAQTTEPPATDSESATTEAQSGSESTQENTDISVVTGEPVTTVASDSSSDTSTPEEETTTEGNTEAPANNNTPADTTDQTENTEGTIELHQADGVPEGISSSTDDTTNSQDSESTLITEPPTTTPEASTDDTENTEVTTEASVEPVTDREPTTPPWYHTVLEDREKRDTRFVLNSMTLSELSGRLSKDEPDRPHHQGHHHTNTVVSDADDEEQTTVADDQSETKPDHHLHEHHHTGTVVSDGDDKEQTTAADDQNETETTTEAGGSDGEDNTYGEDSVTEASTEASESTDAPANDEMPTDATEQTESTELTTTPEGVSSSTDDAENQYSESTLITEPTATTEEVSTDGATVTDSTTDGEPTTSPSGWWTTEDNSDPNIWMFKRDTNFVLNSITLSELSGRLSKDKPDHHHQEHHHTGTVVSDADSEEQTTDADDQSDTDGTTEAGSSDGEETTEAPESDTTNSDNMEETTTVYVPIILKALHGLHGKHPAQEKETETEK